MEIKDFNSMFLPVNEQVNVKPEATLSQLDAIVKSARECVNTQQFHSYKAKFEKEEKEMLTVLISYTNTFILNENANPAMYGMRVAMYIQKLYDLRRLLRTVENDSSKRTGEPNESK